jgi:4-amino-4-deoxy-L-arabinose transferase-like glycosyltransferase
MAPLVPGLADLIDAARTQQPRFLPHFPLDLASMVTGVTPLAEVAIGAVLVVAAAQYLRSGPPVSGGRRRHPLLAGAIALAVVLGIEWLVLRPPNLDGRFVAWLVPAAAIAVATTLGPRLRPGLRGACAAVALVAVVAMVVHQVPTWTTPDLPLREAAAWIRAHRQGGIVCADGSEGEAFLGYGLLPRPLIHADQAYRCELVVQLGPPGPYHVMGAVRAALPRTVTLRGGVTDIRIHHR